MHGKEQVTLPGKSEVFPIKWEDAEFKVLEKKGKGEADGRGALEARSSGVGP